jgi:hypothetical protein
MCHMLHVTCHVRCRMSFVICHLSFAICHMSYAICCMPYVIFHMSLVIIHQPSVISHQSLVIRHHSSVISRISYIISYAYASAPPYYVHTYIALCLVKQAQGKTCFTFSQRTWIYVYPSATACLLFSKTQRRIPATELRTGLFLLFLVKHFSVYRSQLRRQANRVITHPVWHKLNTLI